MFPLRKMDKRLSLHISQTRTRMEIGKGALNRRRNDDVRSVGEQKFRSTAMSWSQVSIESESLEQV